MASFSSMSDSVSHLTRNALNSALQPFKTAPVMGRLVRRYTRRPGSPPGLLLHTGPRLVEEVRFHLMEYDEEGLQEREFREVPEAFPARDTTRVSWVNVEGLHEVEILAKLRDHFGLHLLVMEDVVNVGQRPKMEEHDGYLFFVLPMLSFDGERQTVEMEQLSLILGPTWVLTFRERAGDALEPVRDRLRAAHGRIRSRGADYLAYALVDAVVDHYFAVLERLGDAAEALDQEILGAPSPDTLRRVNHLKRELLVLRKAIWPLREALNGLARSESELVTAATRVFVRDVHDHAVQIIDTVETLRDLASGMSDLYLSILGHRTNEVMKVLTVMASIFIPLTFVAGVYGMNFEHMPELQLRWAYPAVLAAMGGAAVGMLVYFRKRRWV